MNDGVDKGFSEALSEENFFSFQLNFCLHLKPKKSFLLSRKDGVFPLCFREHFYDKKVMLLKFIFFIEEFTDHLFHWTFQNSSSKK